MRMWAKGEGGGGGGEEGGGEGGGEEEQAYAQEEEDEEAEEEECVPEHWYHCMSNCPRRSVAMWEGGWGGTCAATTSLPGC